MPPKKIRTTNLSESNAVIIKHETLLIFEPLLPLSPYYYYSREKTCKFNFVCGKKEKFRILFFHVAEREKKTAEK